MKKMKFVLLSTLLLTSGLFTSCNNTSKVDVMVVGVHHEEDYDEIDILIDNLTNKNKQVVDNLNFYTGNIGKKRVVIAETPLRTSAAAMTTTIGIKQYHPKYVINEGTSGGHHAELTYNDIILGKDILDMASYKGAGDNPDSWELKNPTLHANEALLNTASGIKSEHVGKVVPGIIASSDAWNNDIGFIEKLYKNFGEDCEEMESYAVTTVCDNYKIPSLAIRVISNNTVTGEGFKTEPGKNCQRFVIDVIKGM